MKKLILAALAAFTLLSLVPHDAGAVSFAVREIGWRDGASGVQAVTNKQNLGVGINDTTVTFSTEGWALPNFGTSVSATVADSLLIGAIILAPDSSASYTPSATSATIIIEGAPPGFNDLNFTPMATLTLTNPTTTDKVWRVPLFINPWLLFGDAAKAPNFGNVWPRMRMRIVTVGGTFSACRVFVQHFQD